jgi:hypothetical protein
MEEAMSDNHERTNQPHIEHVGPNSPWAHLRGDDYVRDESLPITTGEEAAAHARTLVAHYIGGEEALEKALGRPSLEAEQPQGVSPNRQVRLGPELDDALTRYVAQHNTSRSAVIRQALTDLLSRHQASNPTPA